MFTQIIISSLLASIVGSIILIMVTIIGFFLVRHFNTQDKLIDSINKLGNTISGMNATIMLLTEKQDSHEKQYKEHRTNCEKRFDKIDARL